MRLLNFLTSRNQEVVLPLSIGKVAYMVAGDKAYEGDLVITRNVIYYFPHTDLIRRRIDSTANLSAALLMGGGNLGAVLAAILNNKLNRSRQRDNSDIPKGEDVTSSLEDKLDTYVSKMKLREGWFGRRHSRNIFVN